MLGKITPLIFGVLVLGIPFLLPARADDSTSANSPRQHLLVDNNWRFHLGDVPLGTDDSTWRTVNLPHDWSIEGTIDPKSPTGPAEAFLPEGIGWYQRTFTAPESWRGKVVTVEFEGVYMNAKVWLNGQELGIHPYGYTSFHFDLTSHLKIGAANTLAVRVDNSAQVNCRWYSGSGIYRHVWLTVTDPVHIAPWGVFVSTRKSSAKRAEIAVQTEIKNDGHADVTAKVVTELLGPDGQSIGSVTTSSALKGADSASLPQEIAVTNPPLWSPERPQLCRAITRVFIDGKVVDQTDTPFGIRFIQWSTTHGLQVNGRTIKLVGGCIHQDNGCLGSAAFDRAEERRIELLRKAGFNALRMAHNPPSPAMLAACDRLGMLVLDEAFDCWSIGKTNTGYQLDFDKWWQRDIDSMVERDRNHPSIIMWSIGNEIPQEYDPKGPEIAKSLTDEIRKNDTTRPITEAFNGRPGKDMMATWDKLCSTLDIIGYNYNIDQGIGEDHVRVPGRVMVSTETFPEAAFSIWDGVQKNSFVIGKFVWTAMDYLGESGIGAPPNQTGFFHGAYCGYVDSIGTYKDIEHYHNVLWNRGEKLYLTVEEPSKDGKPFNVGGWAVYPTLTSWNWPGQENKPMKVEVYSRFDSVRLYQDGKLVGEKPTTAREQFKATFDVTYAPGTLKAVGVQDGKPGMEQSIMTVGAPAAIRLTPDRKTLQANGQDLSFVLVELMDKDGHLVQNADAEIHFGLTGNGTIAGVGSGDMTNSEPYQGKQRMTFHGRALVVVRTAFQSGALHLTAQADGLKPASVSLNSEAADMQDWLP